MIQLEFIKMSQKPIFKTISLEDKPVFDRFFSRYEPETSELTFSNLYIWRQSKNTRFAEWEEKLLIIAEQDKKSYFMPPVGIPYDDRAKSLLSISKLTGDKIPFRRVGEKLVENLPQDTFQSTEDRDHFDYVYLAEDLAFLKGRKFDGKRGFLSKFMNNQPHQISHYNETFKSRCLDLAERWAMDKNVAGVDEELDAIHEYLDNFSILGCCGMVLHDGDRIIGFTFGERLNSNTFVVHFEKCDTAYTGAYQAINNMFVQNKILGKFKFVNREQDLGIEGIRKAKLSYHPVKLVKKYAVIPV